MKKSLFILATAAIALASCSKDKTVEVNETLLNGNEVSFRALESGVMRAAIDPGVKTTFAEGNSFNVYADYAGSKYFQADFTKQAGGTFTSVNKYYWPSDIGPSKAMTFTAIYGATQVVDDPGAIADYSPAAAAASQVDVLLAKESFTAKPSEGGTAGAAKLNFRHTLFLKGPIPPLQWLLHFKDC